MTDALNGRSSAQERLANPAAFTVLIGLLWIVPGLIGHDPWRPEANSIALISHIQRSGDWIVPAIAGVPFAEAFPLYHVTAAWFARALSDVLPLHDAARLATGAYMALAFLFTALAARALIGARAAWLAPLALMGCIGLVTPAHALSPDSAQIMAFALGFYGLALARDRAVAGGLALGCSIGIGFLSNGTLALGSFSLTALLLPAISPGWRRPAFFAALAIAAVVAVPWLALWPALLKAASPEAFQAWWALNGPARFTGPLTHVPVSLAYLLGVLPWFAFPALPLGLWAFWACRRDRDVHPAMAACAVLAGSVLLLLALDAHVRQRDALPFLVPVCVLAVLGLQALRRSAANGFWWFSILLGSIMVLMGWFEWSALELGFPGARHRHWMRQQPAYVPGFDVLVAALALVITAIWVGVIKLAGSRSERPLMAWSGGVAVIWALALAMFLEYADLGKSYRPVATAFAKAARGGNCVAGQNLGRPQQVLLSYLSGIPIRADTTGSQCEMLLVQGTRSMKVAPETDWEPLWEGARPGERREIFRLYRRQP